MIIRRVLDVLLSVVGLIVCAPFMAIIGVLVKRDSPGPAIFSQERVGLGGEPFVLYKFRTMAVDAHGPKITAAGSDRITRVGRWLRKSKLDELPQLVNVAKGDMSIVGPRPEVQEYVQLWPADLVTQILSVRPGITDPVTVSLRDEQEILAEVDDPETYYRQVLLPEKATGYAEYVRNRTLSGDLRVVLGTIKAVFRPDDRSRANKP